MTVKREMQMASDQLRSMVGDGVRLTGREALDLANKLDRWSEGVPAASIPHNLQKYTLPLGVIDLSKFR